MNRTIISIELHDNGCKEATIIVTGERNNQIIFEEQFDYKDEEKHSLRLHLLKRRFMEKFPKFGESLGILCIRKLFNDITIRSKMCKGCRPSERIGSSARRNDAFCGKVFDKLAVGMNLN